MLLLEKYAEHDLSNKACLIDTNHANSGKKFKEQIRIAKDVMNGLSTILPKMSDKNPAHFLKMTVYYSESVSNVCQRH